MKRLPIEEIDGKRYFRDDRLREYRSVDNPHDRIAFAGLLGGIASALMRVREIVTRKAQDNRATYWRLETELLDIIDNRDALTRSDLQEVVRAFAGKLTASERAKGKEENPQAVENEILDLIDTQEEYTRSDLQGVVMAFLMRVTGLRPFP